MRLFSFLLSTLVLLMPLSAQAFTLSSPDVAADSVIDSKFVFNGFGCNGRNVSPALKWDGAPVGTQSFGVTVYDPDARAGSGWWHWIIYDLPANSTGLPTGIGSGAMGIPKHVKQGKNDYGSTNYGGPCPPIGDKPHHYVFTVYALKALRLDVPADASPAMIETALNAVMLAKAEFTATYGRVK